MSTINEDEQQKDLTDPKLNASDPDGVFAFLLIMPTFLSGL
ncbi:MAG: hypothetical protein N3D85_01665 [Candidatus Bathyarchaeota archaeon]|nr:hypothetical protein [Candidatus Bathyarchaeota archaeon]